jgi:hypothetical protein
MSLDLPKLTTPVMTADGELAGDAIAVRFTGTADTEGRLQLEGFVAKLHDAAARIEVATVVIDFRELEFMNSSCFKIFVAWLAKLRDSERPYKILIRSNPNLLWQRRSLAALSCFAVDLVTIEA